MVSEPAILSVMSGYPDFQGRTMNGDEMNRDELLLLMAVCELLNESKTVPQIQRAYQDAAKRLDQYERNQAKPRPQRQG
jgi:hypothetical protein